MTRAIVIGDVHGCADELEALLQACAYAPGDEVVLVGDLVTKGPDGPRVLAIMRRLGARSVCGNHDAALLRYADARRRGEAPERAKSSVVAAAARLSQQDWALLRSLPLWLRLPRYRALVVHGGLVPGIPLEAQEPDLLMNLRTLRPDGSGSARPDDGELWATRWNGPELVLFGHHAAAGLQWYRDAIGLDTGCVYGGCLSACVLPARTVVSVPAARVYQEVSHA